MWIIRLTLITMIFSIITETNVRSDVPPLGSLLNEALQASKAQGVSLIVKNSLENEFVSRVLKEVLQMITENYPTLYTDSDHHATLTRNEGLTTTKDLFLYFFGSQKEPGAEEIKKIGADLVTSVQDIVRPKVLLLTVLEEESKNARTIFDMMWGNKILDATILEVLHFGSTMRYIVRKYNPFTDVLSSENYSPSTEWYFQKFPNMNGYPVKFSVFHRPPHTEVSRDRFGNVKKIGGVDAIIIQILARKMNFTPEHRDEKDVGLVERMANGSIAVIFPNLLTGKVDLIASVFPMIFPEYYVYVHYTTTVHIETWCFAVPKLQSQKKLFEGNPLKVITISLTIILIYWFVSVILRFNRRCWEPLDIAAIILSISLPSSPTRFVERVVYLSLITTSALYSSTLYVQLTTISMGKDFDLPFDELTDLLHSDLILMVHKPVLKVILEENEILSEYFRKPSDAWKTTDTMILCVNDLIRFKNTSCFMDKGWAELAAVANMRNGETILKRTNLCYMSPPAGYAFQKGSPYVEQVSRLLLMMNEAGLRYKLFQGYIRNQSSETRFKDNARKSTGDSDLSVINLVVYVLACGYLTSFLAFVGEMLLKRVDMDGSGYWRMFGWNLDKRKERIGGAKRIRFGAECRNLVLGGRKLKNMSVLKRVSRK